MYNAIKTNSLTDVGARQVAGNAVVDALLTMDCAFTGRVIDDCGAEMSASLDFVDADGYDRRLTILYIVDSESLIVCDDLSNLDYSNYTFQIN
jgi:hypothetical protein